MKANQTSKRNDIQDILCPFTDVVITQGSGINGNSYSHNGTRAIDVRGKEAGVKYPYYAPFDCKAVDIDLSNGQTVWKSIDKVRFADGTIDYCTFLTAHDNTINYGVGYIAKQGNQIANMGDKGDGVTGVHSHIEFAKGSSWLEKSKYGVYGLHNSVEFEEACFMDNTNIISATAKWVYLKDVPVEDTSALKGQIEQLQKEISDLTVVNSKLKKDLDDDAHKIRILEAIVDDLKAESTELQNTNNLLSKDNNNLISEIEKLNNQIEELKAQADYQVLFNLGKLYFCIKRSEVEK